MRKHVSETSAPQRLLSGLLVGLAAAALPLPLVWQFRALLGWSVGVGLVVVRAL